mgnify:CR=1 FL=1
MQLQTSRLKALDRDEKQYTCMACKKSFSKKNNFKRHTLTHTGVKPYNCALCGRGFSQKYNLKQHSHIHKEKPNMCHLCGHTVAANLTHHMKTHTGEKPYDARIVGNCSQAGLKGPTTCSPIPEKNHISAISVENSML